MHKLTKESKKRVKTKEVNFETVIQGARKGMFGPKLRHQHEETRWSVPQVTALCLLRYGREQDTALDPAATQAGS